VARDLRNGEERPLEATALFVLIGSMPHITWLQGQIPLDDEGDRCGMFETGRHGVFATVTCAAAR
jgi:thioredoxin reductase (NADPH)